MGRVIPAEEKLLDRGFELEALLKAPMCYGKLHRWRMTQPWQLSVPHP